MPPLCGVNEKLLSEALKNVDELKRNRRLVSDPVQWVRFSYSGYMVEEEGEVGGEKAREGSI